MEIITTMAIPLILGLTFFLFGMNVMSGGLKQWRAADLKER